MNVPIHVEDLCVAYGRGSRRREAVRELSFDVRQGECVGFIGVNGAGKSTTLKTLMGFVYPDRGRAEIHGLAADNPEARRRVGFLPETAWYYPFMQADELLMLYGVLGGMKRSEARARIPGILDSVGLGGRGRERIRTFSKGMQQRLGIAQALITEPDILILDEVSSGLDPLGRHDLRRLLQDLKSQGRTIFFSSHELSEVETLCDRILLIHEGRLRRQVTGADLRAIGRERSLESFFIAEVRGAEPAS